MNIHWAPFIRSIRRSICLQANRLSIQPLATSLNIKKYWIQIQRIRSPMNSLSVVSFCKQCLVNNPNKHLPRFIGNTSRQLYYMSEVLARHKPAHPREWSENWKTPHCITIIYSRTTYTFMLHICNICKHNKQNRENLPL